MSVTMDRAFSVLLAIFSAGHGFIGVLWTEPFLDSSTVWAFSGSVAAWAVAVLNWLRAGRPDDIVIAVWAVAGALAWMLLMIWLAVAAEMLQDIRIWLFVFVSGGLVVFGLHGIVRAKHTG
jgi:hypothetical protein